MPDLHPLFLHRIELVLVLWEPIEPKHRDISIVERQGKGFRTHSYNLPSTQLLETRIGYLARRALVDMTRYALALDQKKLDKDLAPPEEVISAIRGEFARQETRLEVLVGSTRGGKNADLDNTLKLVSDGLSPVLFPSDRNVSAVNISRIASKEKDDPRARNGILPTIIHVGIRSPERAKASDSYDKEILVFPSHNAGFLERKARVLNAT